MNTNIEWNDFIEKVSDYTGVESNSIKEDTNIYNDLGMDSLGLFSMGMFLIKTYSVNIPISSVARIETVYDIFCLMKEEGTPVEG